MLQSINRFFRLHHSIWANISRSVFTINMQIMQKKTRMCNVSFFFLAQDSARARQWKNNIWRFRSSIDCYWDINSWRLTYANDRKKNKQSSFDRSRAWQFLADSPTRSQHGNAREKNVYTLRAKKLSHPKFQPRWSTWWCWKRANKWKCLDGVIPSKLMMNIKS